MSSALVVGYVDTKTAGPDVDFLFSGDVTAAAVGPTATLELTVTGVELDHVIAVRADSVCLVR